MIEEILYEDYLKIKIDEYETIDGVKYHNDSARVIINGVTVPHEINVLVPPHLVKMTYYNYDGSLASKKSDSVASWLFLCDVDGIDNKFIREVEFPKFSYTTSISDVFVKIKVELLSRDIRTIIHE